MPVFVDTMSRESFVFDGLSLSDGEVFDIIDAPDFAPGEVKVDWIGGPDSDGEIPLDEGRTGNIVKKLSLRVRKQADTDLALQQLGVLVAKLEETRRRPDGLPLIWTPKNATASYTAYVVSGVVAAMPMASRGELIGWLLRSPRVDIVLTCKPFVYGDWVECDAVVSSSAMLEMVVAGVSGHVPAEGRLVLTDTAGHTRKHLEVGMDYHDPDAATLIPASSLDTTAGEFAGLPATLVTQPTAVVGIGPATHVGHFRVKLINAYVTGLVGAFTSAVQLRLAYRCGDGEYSYTAWVSPPATNAACEIDLGSITLSETTTGAQAWDGRLEARTDNAGETLDLPDGYVAMLPIGGGRITARAPYIYRPGLARGADGFGGIAGAMNGDPATFGGTWTTSGSTGDFQGTGNAVTRATTSDSGPRYAILGSTTYTDAEVGLTFAIGADSEVAIYLIVRWTNSSNYAYARFIPPTGLWLLGHVVAGVTTGLNVAGPNEMAIDAEYTLRAVCTASGLLIAEAFLPGGELLSSVAHRTTVLATGGALASGKTGFADYYVDAGAMTRTYTKFYAAAPPAERVVIHSGQSVELTHDSALRESADGTTYGDLPTRGARVWVPPAGDPGREARIVCKARREDVDTTADGVIDDELTAQLFYRPRYRLPAA